MAAIDTLFKSLLEFGGSDLHISQGQPPKIRVHGRMEALDHPVLDEETIVGYMKEICERWDDYCDHLDLDFAYAMGEDARFRCNYFFQENGYAAVFRIIPSRILTMEELGLPQVLKRLGELRSGLVLVTGPTGSGKSTTLAAIIDYINTRYKKHILTIEEPIEFVHKNKNSIICQREVGIDTPSFEFGLKNGLRQDMNVILVGEMRDLETISLAVTAAATGVLVFGTLHTNSATKTVDRIIDVFPADQQDQIRSMLADSLKGIVAQLLMKTADGKGRVASQEILFSSPALSAAIRSNKNSTITSIIQSGRGQGMILMDDRLDELLREGRIDGETAYMKSIDKSRFEQFAPL